MTQRLQNHMRIFPPEYWLTSSADGLWRTNRAVEELEQAENMLTDSDREMRNWGGGLDIVGLNRAGTPHRLAAASTDSGQDGEEVEELEMTNSSIVNWHRSIHSCCTRKGGG